MTGGTKGIGLKCVNYFLASGAEVWASGRGQNMPESIIVLKKSYPTQIHYESVDFADDQSFQHFLSRLKNLSFDILVNNAGINKIDLLDRIDVGDWERIQKVNLTCPFRVMQVVLPQMAAKNWGRVVNVSSIFSSVSKSKRASYSASKFGLFGLTRAAALDFAPQGVLINCLAPGFIDTELTRTVLTEKDIADLTSQVPLNRLGTPEEIAQAVGFLCSEANTFITGQNIIADGGFTSV